MAAVALEEYYAEEAKERQIRKPVDSVVETLPQQIEKSRDKAGKDMTPLAVRLIFLLGIFIQKKTIFPLNL